MANEENLKKGKATQFHSGEEAVRNGKKGGVASGASKRRRRTMQQTVNTLLSAGLNSGEREFVEKVRPRLLALGVDVENSTYQDVLLAGILMKAIRGDVRAAEFIRDLVGDSPYLEIKKQELKLRKKELRWRQKQEKDRTEGAQTIPDGASRHLVDLSNVTDEELAILDEIIGKITAE